MPSHLTFSHSDSPIASDTWRHSSAAQRLALVLDTMVSSSANFGDLLQIATTHADGQVIVQLKKKPSASERSALLLDFEDHLKKTIDQGLTVWLEALGDKNSLRNLRGIEVKQHD
jgi:hypothetical protein